MSVGGWELVTTDEPLVVAKPLLDPIVVENGQSDGCFPNPTSANESDWMEIFSEINHLLNQLIMPK